MGEVGEHHVEIIKSDIERQMPNVSPHSDKLKKKTLCEHRTLTTRIWEGWEAEKQVG